AAGQGQRAVGPRPRHRGAAAAGEPGELPPGGPELPPRAAAVAGARRLLRRRERQRVAGRGMGFALLLLTLPVLLQLVLGQRMFRGEAMDAGGVLGRFLAESLVARFNFPGSLLLVGALA